MTGEPTFKVEIDENGDIKVDTEGFTGEACLEATQKLIDELQSYGIDAVTIGEIKPKDELYEKIKQGQRVTR